MATHYLKVKFILDISSYGQYICIIFEYYILDQQKKEI